jgi:hypothetical protein
MPCEILHTAHLRPFEPTHSADRDDIGARWQEARSVQVMHPVRWQQQPRRRNLAELRDQPLQQSANERRIGDNRVGIIAIGNRQRQCILSGRGIPGGAPTRHHRITARRTFARRQDEGSKAVPPRTASDRNHAGCARNWIACPCFSLYSCSSGDVRFMLWLPSAGRQSSRGPVRGASLPLAPAPQISGVRRG